MVIQIIEENKRKKHSPASQLITGALGATPAALQQYQKMSQDSRKMQSEAMQEELNRLHDLNKLQTEYGLKGELEAQKLQGKQGQLEQKQDFLSKLFAGGQQGQQSAQGVQQGGFDAANLSDEQIAQASSIDPNMGRSLMHAKDVALREKRESPEMKRKQQIASSQAQADVKYNQELQSAEKQHKLKSQSLDRLEKLNMKGVTGKPFEKILEKSGLINLTSEGRREFAADVKNLITDIRSILGSQFSQFEFQTILNAYPSADFSKEANSAIIKNLQEFQDIRNKEFEIAKQIKKENGGELPVDFQSIVNERVQEYAQSKLPSIKENSRKIMNQEYGIPEGNVLMFDPKGEPLNVSPDQVEYFQSLGASLP